MGERQRIHVALLRGINVGGKNKLPMTDLRELFERAGCDAVRTYIQSGNVVFRATPALARRLPTGIAVAVADRFGYRVPVVIRSADELSRVARSNPFLARGIAPGLLHVAFLADKPAPARVRTLDPERSPPDEFVVRGRQVYLCCPNGMAKTKLTSAYLDSRLATTSTVRNWKTVLKLCELAVA